jgi:hypothetical protein
MVFISAASPAWPFRFIASKNIFSLGYIQFPLSLTPLSFSLFAGFSSLLTTEALGIVEISLSTPSSFGVGVAEGEEGAEGVRKREKKLLGAGAGDWSMVDESQLFPGLDWEAAAVAPGKGDLEALDFSHAARVAGSTGQTSAGGSDSFAIAMFDLSVDRREFDDGFLPCIIFWFLNVGA